MNTVDYSIEYRDYLLQQFSESENLNKLFQIEGLHANQLRDLFLEIVQRFYLPDAVGEQLDFLGAVVGIERVGVGDDRYRSLINLKIGINISGGQPRIIINVIRELFSATFVHYKQIRDEPSGNCHIYSDGSLLLFDLFNGITEDGDNLLFDTFGEFNAEREEGGYFLTEEGDTLIFYDTGYGDQAIFTVADEVDESIIYDILPAGVGLIVLDRALTEDDFILLTESDEIILF